MIVIQLLSNQNNVANMRLVPALVSYYTKIGRNIAFNTRAEKTRSFLSSSPVKMLSNFLGGSTPDITSQSPPKGHRGALLSPPPLISRQAAASKESLVDSIRSRHSRDNFPIGGQEGDERPDNPLVRLEHTFTGYVACLQSRKGHFIGRLLLNRSNVDELAVNDLYNRLMESPYDLEASSEATSETMFVAFEKFVRIAWLEQMGPVMSTKHLDLLLQRASRKVPGEFGDFVRYLFNEMAPQNRRAFTALIKLLADLLDGCGNDSDRGALTLAFAQLLVDDGDAHVYINLLDRLVEDADRIFEDPLAALTASFERASAYESMNSTVRSHKSGSGSFTSNTSSLRRKWGLDNLLRSNSKNDSNRDSVWRTLSKHARNPATGESLSLSRAAISRSKSIDVGVVTLPNKLRRPVSRDRPRVAGAFDDLNGRPQSVHRPNSSYRLETIGEPSMGDSEIEIIEPPKPSLRHKRRSSLSDLKSLMDNVTLEDDTATASPTLPPVNQDISPVASPMPLKIAKQTSEKFNSSPRIPLPTKIGKISPKSTPKSSPKVAATIGPSSPSKIGKIPMTPVTQSMRTPRPKLAIKSESLQTMFSTPQTAPPKTAPLPPKAAALQTASPLTGSLRRKHAKTLSTSNIPSLKPSRLPMAGSFTPTSSEFSKSAGPALARSSTQKLRLQSPQKLRERLQTEKRAVEDVDSNLKSELSRISEDMARVNNHMPRSSTSDLRKLSASVKALEDRIPQVLQELDERHRVMQEDMEASLKASEAKVKAIDQLYKEATAENELLYEKFNTELGKIVKAIRGKGRDDREELVTKLKDQSEETAYVKKENARLRRETVSLRSLMKGTGPPSSALPGSARRESVE